MSETAKTDAPASPPPPVKPPVEPPKDNPVVYTLKLRLEGEVELEKSDQGTTIPRQTHLLWQAQLDNMKAVIQATVLHKDAEAVAHMQNMLDDIPDSSTPQ